MYQYEPELCPLLKDCLRTPDGSVDKFCHEQDIGLKTFYRWIKKHPEFHDAYDAGMCSARHMMLSEASAQLYNKDFNFYGWDKVFIRRFSKSFEMVFGVDKTKTPSEQAELIFSQMCNHEMDIGTGEKLLKNLETKCSIIEKTQMEMRLIRIEDSLKVLVNDGVVEQTDLG